MNTMNAFIFTLEAYDRFLDEISNGSIRIKYENGEWFYVVSEDVDDSDEAIVTMLREAFSVDVADVVVDITSQKVAIVY